MNICAFARCWRCEFDWVGSLGIALALMMLCKSIQYRWVKMALNAEIIAHGTFAYFHRKTNFISSSITSHLFYTKSLWLACTRLQSIYVSIQKISDNDESSSIWWSWFYCTGFLSYFLLLLLLLLLTVKVVDHTIIWMLLRCSISIASEFNYLMLILRAVLCSLKLPPFVVTDVVTPSYLFQIH